MKKFALITGCSKGIGKEIALELARDGYNIIGTYNTSLNKIEKLKDKIERIGVSFNYYKLDLLDEDSINNFLSVINESYSKINILVNNAALSLDDDFSNKTRDDFINILKVNLVGPFSLIQGLKSKLETVINIASTDGINTYGKLNIDYSASKAGLINLTKSLSLVLNKVKVVAICPNWVETESIKEMDQDYLKSEMIRVGQRNLIKTSEVANKVLDIVNGKVKSGSIIVMEEANE